jgi:hypothetical protein
MEELRSKNQALETELATIRKALSAYEGKFTALEAAFKQAREELTALTTTVNVHTNDLEVINPVVQLRVPEYIASVVGLREFLIKEGYVIDPNGRVDAGKLNQKYRETVPNTKLKEVKILMLQAGFGWDKRGFTGGRNAYIGLRQTSQGSPPGSPAMTPQHGVASPQFVMPVGLPTMGQIQQ